ncbi:MAG TPA: methylated-DNA--[protein]-cysteine S-methyltransferase [Bacillota bacterium]|nr:methylated-DNA--[protein]-cysteine S-methyltransferase [Bacillota bacterium]
MTKQIVFYDELQTPLGPLTLTATPDDILRIDFGSFSKNEQKIKNYLSKAKLLNDLQNKIINHQIKDELTAYFNKTLTTFTVPNILFGTDFQKDVWRALMNIPYGETVTYKKVAMMINRPKAVRAVGGALNKNPFSIVLPCHRVIGSDGSLTGFGGGIDRKEQLLIFEQKN